jgi:hypothetical protein
MASETVVSLRLKQRVAACTAIDKIERKWFIKERIFMVETPTDTQNDCVYARVSKKRFVNIPGKWRHIAS